MIRFAFLAPIFLIAFFSCRQEGSVPQNPYLPELLGEYDQYREKSITHRRFKHHEISPLLLALREPLKVKVIGHSVEQRSIHMVSYGEGPVSVLLWSQMHGDEPTATMALLDIFNFLEADDTLNPLRELMRAKLSLHFVPMLNPDGAQRYQRRNAQGIDINRDALRLQTPEGQLLKHIRDSLSADWGFNLHDQGRSTSVANEPASISFLAPAFDHGRTVSQNRKEAMQVIVAMNGAIQTLIPNKVGKYWDDYEPRAFGDNIQKWGTKTILIESGGLEGDREKQELRKVNFLAIMTALYAIASDDYTSAPVSGYDNIPMNGREFQDVIIRNLKITHDSINYTIDLAYRHAEIENEKKDKIFLRAAITDIGDLSTSYAYKEFDAAGLEVMPGQTYNGGDLDLQELGQMPVMEWLRQGVTDVVVPNLNDEIRFDVTVPFKLVSKGSESTFSIPQMGENPSFFLKKDGQAVFALINGMVIDLNREWEGNVEALRAY